MNSSLPGQILNNGACSCQILNHQVCQNKSTTMGHVRQIPKKLQIACDQNQVACCLSATFLANLAHSWAVGPDAKQVFHLVTGHLVQLGLQVVGGRIRQHPFLGRACKEGCPVCLNWQKNLLARVYLDPACLGPLLEHK